MTESERRDVLELHLKEHLLGPGYAKEIISCSPDCRDEILDQIPTNLYVTGILVPSRQDNDEQDCQQETDMESAIEADQNEDDETVDNDDEEKGGIQGDSIIDRGDRTGTTDHVGLITCLSPNTSSIEVEVEYAKYKLLNTAERKDVRINMSHHFAQLDELLAVYDNDGSFSIRVNGVETDRKLSDYIGRDNDERTIWLTDFVTIDNRLSQQGIDVIKSRYSKANVVFKTLFNAFYKREEIRVDIPVDVSEEGNQAVFENSDIRIVAKVFISGPKKYVKLLVINNIVIARGSKSSYNQCLFQTELKVSPTDGTIVSYTEPVSIPEDVEGKTLNFTYRDVRNYGKGICCAVEWDDNGNWIKTSYFPKSDVRKFSNKLDQDYCNNLGINQTDIERCCGLINLSHWSQLNNIDYFSLLEGFVNGYGKWCEQQCSGANNLGNTVITNGIIAKQQELLSRLRDNVDYLRNNAEALMCFKLANTAMLIQMTIARHESFKKNRLQVAEPTDVINNLNWFRTDPLGCSYYPFQLAFLLMNVKSTFDVNDRYHNDVVDMIWFPTGGGKTEAYLALTALTIIARRRSTNDGSENGISVIMRYTLRLLTSQQFERASYLICALEFMRNQRNNPFNLGNVPITIGLWIGDSGKVYLGIHNKWGRFDSQILRLNGSRAQERLTRCNPYPVSYCPWCGQKLVTATGFGYNGGFNRRDLQCLNTNCLFNQHQLPIYFVDDDVRRVKPTLLFATVDKFAGLEQSARDLFINNQFRSPDLIIQDELHLISGPLGSLVGLFESVVEKVCTKGGRRPKIIASTATTRNTDALIRSLYNRQANIFPAPGIKYDDNYFSHIESESLRRHMGICPQGFFSPVVSEIHIIAQIVLGRILLFRKYLQENGINIFDCRAVSAFIKNQDDRLIADLDIFWPLVLYYNSLKDLGRTNSRVAEEIRENIRANIHYLILPETLDFVIENMTMRTKEFTSREDSSRIKDLLTGAETPIGLSEDNNGKLHVTGNTAMDIILASNMISVGIDIDRWNIMMMSGQPRSTSEYIQSSSRVGRRHKGLVVNLYSPMRNREFSMFENYTSYHESYYKFVEPLSATPVTLQTIHHPVFINVIRCYRYLFNYDVQRLTDELTDRFHLQQNLSDAVYDVINNEWNGDASATSLRDIDVDDYIKINEISYQ